MTRLLLLPVLAALTACGAASEPPDIRIADAWARPAAAPQRSTAAYLTITNVGGTDALTRISTPVGTASLHSMTMAGGVMRMRPMANLEVGRGEPVQLRPGGNHAMITDLKKPLTPGQSFPMTLSFKRSGDMTVVVTVREASGEMM